MNVILEKRIGREREKNPYTTLWQLGLAVIEMWGGGVSAAARSLGRASAGSRIFLVIFLQFAVNKAVDFAEITPVTDYQIL